MSCHSGGNWLTDNEVTWPKSHKLVSVQVGLRPWMSDGHALLPPLGVRGSATAPLAPNCFHQAQVNVSVPTQLEGFPSFRLHPLPAGRRRKQREKNLTVAGPSSWPGQDTHSLEKFHLWFSITKLLI